jgi:hypothetical protein
MGSCVLRWDSLDSRLGEQIVSESGLSGRLEGMAGREWFGDGTLNQGYTWTIPGLYQRACQACQTGMLHGQSGGGVTLGINGIVSRTKSREHREWIQHQHPTTPCWV